MSIAAACLIDIPAALRPALERALGDAGCRIDERKGHRADPAALLLHALDGSPASLANLKEALAAGGTPARARAVLLAGEAGAMQAAGLGLPATWALLPWPVPAGWLALTMQRAQQLAEPPTTPMHSDAGAGRADARACGGGANVLAQALSASGLFDFEYDLGNGQRRPASSDAAMLGHSPKDFAEANSYIHPDDRAHVRDAFQRCRATGCAYHVELRVLRREGSYRWMRSEGSVVDRSARHPGRLLGVNRDIHEEREARDAARSARRRLDQALTTAGMLSWEWEPTDGMRRVVGNGLGLPRSEHEPGLALEDLIHAEDREVDRLRFDNAVHSVDRYQSEIRIEVPGLGARWLQLTGYPRRAASGQLVGMSGLGLDVTRRRIADEELADAHALLIDSLEAGRMYCWEHNLIDGSRRTIGPYQDILGVAADADLDAKALVHPADIAEDSARWSAAIQQRRIYESTYRVVRPDGQVRWMQSRGNPIVGADGKVARISGVAIDISAQKSIESELAESREWQRLAVEAGELNLWQVDLASGERRGGGLDQRLFGCVPTHIGELAQLTHPEDRARVDDAWRTSIESGAPYDLDYRLIHRDGRIRWVRVRGKCLRDATLGRPVMVGASMDITEQVQLETELRNAVRLARAASEAKSAFLASISHELRTPLNAVIGFSGLLLDSATDRVQSAHLNSLNSAAQLLYRLINDVLDFSRIEAGEMAMESTPFCLQDCLETALDMVAASASAKCLSLLMTVRGPVHRKVVGDPTRLRQVAVNLLSNATKFTQRGMVALELDGAEHADGIELTMRVRDTGIGMSADVLGLLFEPFRQGDVSTTRRFGGTGLGLSICKRLIGLMGGAIEVSSKPGAGSCFTVRLLLPLASERGDRPAMLSGRRIGVAVDKVFIRNALIQQVQELGAEAVALAGDAPIALFDDTRAALDVLVVAERSVREHLAKAVNWPRCAGGTPLPVVVLAPFDRPLHPWRGRHGESYFPIAQVLKPRTLHHALSQALDDGSALPALARPGAAAGRREASGRFGSLRVLVAEDNEINQTLILLQLQSFGVTATLVGNGQEALDALRAAPFDVVLMDVEMPGMDGMEAATRIRDDPDLRERSPCVIAVTAHVLGGSRQRFMASGMDDLISKPVMMDDLRDALDRVLASRLRPSEGRRRDESRLPELGD